MINFAMMHLQKSTSHNGETLAQTTRGIFLFHLFNNFYFNLPLVTHFSFFLDFIHYMAFGCKWIIIKM
jgi:hypothetical protein